MAQTQNKPQTLGNFNITGFLTVDDKTFQMNLKGKNNENWLRNVFNPKIETDTGKSMFVYFQDGFDSLKGKTIYTMIKDTTESMTVSFADRKNETILSQIDDKSFIKVALQRIKLKNDNNEEYETWDYNKFLTQYDAIDFLKQKLPIGSKIKVRITGRTKYQVYNNELSKVFEMQSFYLLPESDTSECEFKFVQNVLLTQDAVDLSKWETENIATMKAKIYQKKKQNEYEVLVLPLVIRAEDEKKKATYNKLMEKYLIINDDTVRRIKIEGIYNIGYVVGNISENDLPDEAKELISDGLYSQEEVFKMYANKNKVNEMVFTRPHMQIDSTSNLPKIDYNDSEFTKEDLENLIVCIVEDEIIIPDNGIDKDLLDELENL